MNPYITTFPSPADMRRLPWHVAVRADRKAMLTALGIALGVAFTFLSFSIPHALQTETIDPEGPFGRQDAVVRRPDLEPFSLDIEGATRILLVRGERADGGPVLLAALDGPAGVAVTHGQARPPYGGSVPDPLALRAPVEATLVRGAPIEERSYVARGWTVVDGAWLRAAAAAPADAATYLLVPGLSPQAAEQLEKDGFVVDAAPGVEPFFRKSASEVARDLLLVVAFSSVLVTLFTYEFLRSEVRERRREIGLWRAIGMKASDVLALLVARAAAIGIVGLAAGGLAGVALLAVARRWTGSELFRVSLTLLDVILLSVVFLVAAAAGGAIPAFRASRTSVRASLEADE